MQPELTPTYVCRRRRTGSQDRTDLDELLEIYFLALPAQEKLHPPCCERPPAESQRGAASSSVVFARGADDCCRLDFSYSCLVLCQGSRIPQQVACCLAPPGRRPLLRVRRRGDSVRAAGRAGPDRAHRSLSLYRVSLFSCSSAAVQALAFSSDLLITDPKHIHATVTTCC